MIFEQETYRIRGAIFEVYNQLGSGFLESVYQEALAVEFRARGIPFVEQEHLRLYYKDIQLRSTFQADFVTFGKIIVELKAVKQVTQAHKKQLINYLKSTRLQLGILVNFGSFPQVMIKRVVSNHDGTFKSS